MTTTLIKHFTKKTVENVTNLLALYSQKIEQGIEVRHYLHLAAAALQAYPNLKGFWKLCIQEFPYAALMQMAKLKWPEIIEFEIRTRISTVEPTAEQPDPLSDLVAEIMARKGGDKR